jgi:GMP synthase (glutamine-hydrolysing)
MKPLLIAKTGGTFPDFARRHGDFEAWFARGLGLPRQRLHVVAAHREEALPGFGGISGVVITGSHAMVTDRALWSETLAAWLAGAVASGLPVLGVCFGHQLLAHALGGRVDYHPAGPEVGTVTVELTPAARDDVLLGALPAAFAAHATHAQSVLDLPPGAVHLAGNAYEPHHAFRVGRWAWGIQFHPEFDTEVMCTYAKARKHRGDCPACDWDAVLSSVRETPESAGVLRRFGELVSRRETGRPTPDDRAVSLSLDSVTGG